MYENFSLLLIFTRFNLLSYILFISLYISLFFSSFNNFSSFFCSSLLKRISIPVFFSVFMFMFMLLLLLLLLILLLLVLFFVFFLLRFLFTFPISSFSSSFGISKSIFDIKSFDLILSFVLIQALFSSLVIWLVLSFSSLKGILVRANFKSSFESIFTESESISFIKFSFIFVVLLRPSSFIKLFSSNPPNLSITSFKYNSEP